MMDLSPIELLMLSRGLIVASINAELWPDCRILMVDVVESNEVVVLSSQVLMLNCGRIVA